MAGPRQADAQQRGSLMVAPADHRIEAGPRSARLRILYLIDSLGSGGAEHLLAAYLRHLPALGIDPTVAALQDRGGNPTALTIEALGIPVLDLGIERLRQRGAYRDVGRAIDRQAPDLVHTQLEFANVLGAPAASRRGIPVVGTLHTLEEPAPWSRAGMRMRLMARSLRRHADLVVAVSEHARLHHLEHLRLDPARVTTIHNGIDIAGFRTGGPHRAAVRAEFGIPAGASLIVVVAVLRPPKGIDRLILALPTVIEAIPSAHCLIVGDGDAGPGLERMAIDQGIADRVTFSGARADVPRMLAAADLFVLPSLTEALPTVVAEAMAAGLPVVATRVGGTPEMVDDSTGVLVEPGDIPRLGRAIVQMLGDPTEAAIRGRQGRAVAAERFDLATQAARLVDHYRRLIAARRR